jgi:hypothetical protein
MGHARELLERIAAKVERSWPSKNGYVYIYEKPVTKGMLPDIQVLDQRGTVRCVVEIGYTRPEKLTAYRQRLKIEDVRWYDKHGVLHGDVQEKLVIRNERLAPPAQLEFYALPIWNFVCPDCFDEMCADWDDDRGTPAAAEEAINVDEVSEEASVATWGHILTNGHRLLLVYFCDQCGRTELSKNTHDILYWGLLCDLDDYLRTWSRRHRHSPIDAPLGSYPTMLAFIREQYDVDVSYDDFVARWEDVA